MKKILTLAVLFCMLFSVSAETPVRTEELIYSIAAFSGYDYALTFAKEDSDAIFLYADADNFVSVKKNLVYYWPITEQWMIDDSVLDISFDGLVEIKGKGTNLVLDPVEYTFFNIPGTYQSNWHVATGEAAVEEWNTYMRLILEYQMAVSDYNRKFAAYQSRATTLFQEIMKARDEERFHDDLLMELEQMVPPVEPPKPDRYTIPPVGLQVGYLINLPEGTYSIRFLTRDGKELQGTAKKLVMVSERRANTIGYDVFPADKWTQPSESNTQASVLYVNGNSELYVRPFFQNEYRDLHYNRLINNQNTGNPNLFNWVKIQQVPNSFIKTLEDGKNSTISENPYIVEQTQTAALGYSIVPYDPTGLHKGKAPSISAFRIPVSSTTNKIEFFLQDASGAIHDGSKREIRVITGVQGIVFSVIVLLIPMVGFVVYRRVRKQRLSQW
jgi:hypothetical protein